MTTNEIHILEDGELEITEDGSTITTKVTRSCGCWTETFSVIESSIHTGRFTGSGCLRHRPIVTL